jgi:hypothetical protein
LTRLGAEPNEFIVWAGERTRDILAVFNEGISAASFCCQVAAVVPGMFCNFYFVKNHKIANNTATTEAREKISTYLESLKF